MLLLVVFAWLLSANRRIINWRVVAWGLGLQMIFAVFIFVVPAGSKVFLFINDVVVRVLEAATAGTQFVFGRFALGPGHTNAAGETSLGFILAFQSLPTIISGANSGVRLVVGIVALLLAFLGLMANNALQQPRSLVITAYALCGFAHIASLAIFVGGISALAPKRTRDLARLGPRALLAATFSCLLTAAVAGTFFNHTSILIQ